MPEDINNTQTGGEGVTTQEGSNKVESKTIETPKAKPVEQATKEPAKTKEPKVTKTPDKDVSDAPAVKGPDVDVDLIKEDLKEEDDSVVPMVANLPEPDKGTFSVPSDVTFEVPEEPEEPEIHFEVPEEDDPIFDEDDLKLESNVMASNADEAQELWDKGYRVKGAETSSRGGLKGMFETGRPGLEMVLSEPEPEILKYGNNPQDYSVRDGEWYIREDANSEWTKINERWRVRTLNQTHGKNVPVPEETYKPVKGGEVIDGVRVYGSSMRPGTTYTIRDGSWWRLPKDGEWERVIKSKNVESLNNEHGEKVLTDEKKQSVSASKSASSSPETAKGVSLDELRTKEKHDEFEEKEKEREFRENLKKDLGLTPEELAESLKPNIEKAGEVLEKKSGLGLKREDVPIGRDENYDAIINSADYGDGLLNDTYPETKVGDPETFGQLTSEQSEWNDRQKYRAELEENLRKSPKPNRMDAYHKAGGATGSLSTTRHYSEKQKPPTGTTVMAEMWRENMDSTPEEREETMFDVTSAAKKFQDKIDELEKEKPEDIIPFKKKFKDEFEFAQSQHESAERMLANHDLKIFTDKDIDAWAEETNLTESQIKGLKDVQELAKTADSKDAKNILTEVDEYLYDVRVTNNKLAEASNRGKDLNQILTENKKVFYEENKDIIKDEVGQLFMATLAIREFVDDYVDEGKIEIDSKGGYKIKDTVSDSEKAYIEARLGALIDNYNEAKSAMYSDNRKLIAEKRKKIKSLDAALSKLRKNSTPEDAEYVNKTVGEYIEQLKRLRAEVKSLLEDDGAIFQTDPEGLAKDVSTSKSRSAKSILNSIPESLDAKQKFDLFYESLLDKTKRMAQDNKIDSGYFDRVGQRVRDILDWDIFGVELSDEEVEYFKNKATLTKLMPVYLNNDAGVTSESAGFFESFMNQLTATLSPNIAAAEGWIKDTDRVRAIQKIASEPILGIDPLELASITTMEQLRARTEIAGFSGENIGNLLGTTSGIMIALMGGMGLTSGTIKLGKGTTKLFGWLTSSDKISDIPKYAKRLEQAYTNAMKSTKMGKFLFSSIEEGKNFYLTGVWFNQDDGQMTFAAGFGGALGGKLFSKLYKNMPPSALVDLLGRTFGASTDKAVIAMQKFGNKMRVAKAANYRGQGEIAQEFVQELTSIYYEELGERGFWEEVSNRFGSVSQVVEFAFTSWVLGAAIGTVFADSHQDFIESMSDADYKIYQEMVKEASVDMATAKAAEDMAAENIVAEETAVDGETEQATEEVAPEKDATEDVSTEEDGDSIVAKTVEEAKAKWAEGYRIKGIDSEAGIEGMFATRGKKGINMTKPKPKERDFQSKVADAKERGLTLGEFAAEQEAEADGDFQSDLADAKERGLTMPEFVAEQEAKQADKIEPSELSSKRMELSALKEKAVDDAVSKSKDKNGELDMVKYEKLRNDNLNSEDIIKAEKELNEIKKKLPKMPDIKLPETSKIIDKDGKEHEVNINIDRENRSIFIGQKNSSKPYFGVSFNQDLDGSWYANNVRVSEEIRRKGIASGMYDIFSDLGLELKKSSEQTPDGKKLWESLESKSVEEGTVGDKIRKGKFGDDITMSGIPGFKQAWNTAVEVAAVGAQVTSDTINKIIDHIVNSEWYQELEQEEKQRANAELNKIAEGLVETGVKHKVPKTPTSQLQTIKNKISEFKKAYAKGEKAGKKLSKEEASKKKDLIDWIQTELLSYARENLPTEKKYSQAEVTAMANKLMVKKPRELDAALDYIDKKLIDFQDAARVKSAEDLIKLFNDPQLKKGPRGKVSKIGVEAEKEIKDLREQNSDEDILNMTQEEVSALKAKLDDIIDKGKTGVKDIEYAKKKGKREQRAVYHKELSKQTESQTKKLSGEKDINTFFAGGKGVIYIGDQVFSSKTAVKEYLKDNDLTYDSIGEVDATYDAETYKNTVNRFTRATRRFTDILTMTGRTLESRIDDIARHSKTLRESLKTNITDATNEAYVLRDEARHEKLGVLYEALKPLGGFNKVNGGVSALEQDTGIKIESPNPKSSISVDLAIKIRNMSMVEPSMIYKVGDSYYDSESEAKAEAKSSGSELEEVSGKYNPYVLRQISQDGSLDSGLKKISEIEEYVDSDEKIKTYADFLINTYYKDSKDLFGDTYKDIYGKEIPDGVYSPLNRVADEGINTDLLRTDNNYSAVTAMSSSLKQRQNPKNLSRKFDLTVGATAEAMNYTNGMTHAKYFLPVAENYKNLINKTTRPELVAKIGEARVKRLETHMNDIISDGGTMLKQEGANILDAYLKYKVVTTLMLKPGSIIKQATSMTHWLGAGLDDGVGTTQVMAQMGKILPAAADMFSKDGAVSKKTLTQGEAEVIQKIFNGAFIKNRVTGKSIDYELSAMHKSIDGGKLRNASNRLSKILLWPTITGDAAGVLLGGVPFTLATYNKNIKDGMTHEDALNDAYLKFNKVAEHTQQSTRRDVISNAQKNQTLRVMLTFKTSQTAAMSQLVKGAKVLTDYASGNKGEYTNAEALNAGRKVVYYTFSQAMFVMAANGTLGMIFGDDDDSDDPTRVTDRQKTARYDAFMDTISSDLQGLGVPGLITDWTLNVLRGREAFNNIPTFELLEDMANVLGGSIEASMYGGDVLPFNESGSSDMSESTLKKMSKIVGLKNILQLGESYSQLNEGEIGYMDAWMGRATEEVEDKVEGATVIKNRKYKTGYEKEDAIFEWWYGPEGEDPEGSQFPEKIDKELSGAESEKDMDSFDDLLDDEKYLDELASPLESKGGYKRDIKFETKERSKREKELKKRSLESIKKQEERRKKNRKESKPQAKTSAADKNKKLQEDMKEAILSYEYKFGEKPPKNWSLRKIKNAVYAAPKR